MTSLKWSRTYGDDEDVELLTFDASVDPPQVAPGGGDDRTSDATTADGGGTVGGFSLARPSLWELLTDTSDEVAMTSPTTLLVEQLEESPMFRRGQVAGALSELRAALHEVSHTAEGHEELSLSVGTVVVLAHTLLRHQP